MAQKPAVETAWQLLAQGKQDQAVTLLRDLIHADPRNADARLLLGSVLMEDGAACRIDCATQRGCPAASEIGRGAQCAGRSLQRIRGDKPRRGRNSSARSSWIRGMRRHT